MTDKQNGEGCSSNNSNSQPKFFKIIASPHDCSRLMFPQDFASRYGNDVQNPSYLEVPNGEVWEVEVVHSEGQIWLAKGWQEFSNYYSINCGHSLMFGYNGRSHFKVIIFDLSATEIGYKRHALERVGAESDEMDENIYHCSLGKVNKRKRQDGDSEEDGSIDQSSKDSREHKQQSKIIRQKNKAVLDKERAITYQRAIAFKSKNPSIVRFMHQSYVSSPFTLSLSLKFASECLLENKGDLVLRVPRRGSWSFKCNIGKGDAKIYWKAFVRDNKLKIGDACVFEVVTRRKVLIDVTIFPTSGRKIMHKIAGVVQGISTYKNKKAKTENSVPSSLLKIVQTETLKQQRGGSYGLNSNIKDEQVEGTEDNIASPSTIKTKRRGESCRMLNQQSKIVYGKNKRIRFNKRDVAYRRAKAFKSKNPFFISFMQPTYVSKPFYLNVNQTFARKHFRGSCCDLLLRVPGKGSWYVRCFRETTKTLLRHGWKAFVEDNKLKHGDVCVFEVIKACTRPLLDVTIFRTAGSTSMRKIAKEVSDSRNKITKPCSRIKQLRGGSYASNIKIKEEHSEGIEIEHCNDMSVGVNAKTIKTRRRGERSRMHKQQSKIVYGKSKTVTDKERTIAYQRAKAFESKNPFIISFMQPSYLSTPYTLTIPSTFARKHYLDSRGDLVLHVPGKGSWSVKCIIEASNAKIRSGWKAFVEDNKLKLGDVCVFEVIKEGRLLLDVTIFHANC